MYLLSTISVLPVPSPVRIFSFNRIILFGFINLADNVNWPL